MKRRIILPDGCFITPEDLIARYKGRISVKTLANWRTKGGGPDYTKIGGKIMYTLSAVQAWEKLRTYGSTAVRTAAGLAIAWHVSRNVEVLLSVS